MSEHIVSKLTGGCTCEAVRYEWVDEPLFVHCCFCRWCQRETGSSYALNALMEHDRVVLTQGMPYGVTLPSNSGKGQTVHRCGNCQVALWSTYAGAGELIRFVRVGTLDEPDRVPPDLQIYTASKQPWVALSPEIPAVPEYYRRSLYWPQHKILRYKAHLQG